MTARTCPDCGESPYANPGEPVEYRITHAYRNQAAAADTLAAKCPNSMHDVFRLIWQLPKPLTGNSWMAP